MENAVRSFCSSLLENCVVPHLRASRIPKATVQQLTASFEDHICRNLTHLSEHVDRCAGVVLPQLEICDDVQKLNSYVHHVMEKLVELDKYISQYARGYFFDILRTGCNKDDSNEIYASRNPSPYRAIQKNFGKVRQCLDIHGSDIRDHLVANNIITEDDEASIIAKPHPREQTEELLKRIGEKCDYDRFSNIVLPAMRKDHPHVSELLQKGLQDDIINPEPGRAAYREKCGVCVMLNKADPGRLALQLYQKEIIMANLYTDLRNTRLSYLERWTMLLNSLKTDSDKDVLMSALRSEYTAIADSFLCDGSIATRCRCPKSEVQDDYTSSVHAGSVDGASDIARNSDLNSMYTDLDCKSKSSDYSSYTAALAPPPVRCFVFCKETEDVDPDVPYQGNNSDTESLKRKLEQFDVSLRRYSNPSYEELRTAVEQMASEDCCDGCSGFICAVDVSLFCDQMAERRTPDEVGHDIITWYREAACPQYAVKPKIFLLLNDEYHQRANNLPEREYNFQACSGNPPTNQNIISCQPLYDIDRTAGHSNAEWDKLERENIFLIVSKHDVQVTGCRQYDIRRAWHLDVIDSILKRYSCPRYSLTAKKDLQRLASRSCRMKTYYNPYGLRKPYFLLTHGLRNTGYRLNGLCLQRFNE